MQVKGEVIQSTIEFIKTTFGDSAFEKVLSHLTTEEQSLLNLRIARSLWYPFELYIHLSEAMVKELGSGEEGDLSLMRAAGGYSAQFGLKTAYKLLFRLGTPTYIIKIARKAYSMYFDEGILEITDSGDKMIKLKLHEIDRINEYHLQRVAGWMEKTFEITGGKNPRVRVTDRHDGADKYVIFTGTWG